MLNGYAFSCPSPMIGGERWYCSGRILWECKVCLHVNDDYELVCVSSEHSHTAPVYEKTKGGLFVEVSAGSSIVPVDVKDRNGNIMNS